MASMWDFSNEDRVQVEEIVEVVRSRKGHCHDFDKKILIDLFKERGYILTIFVIEQSMENDWLKPGRWKELMQITLEFGVMRVSWAIRAMNQLENHSLATVRGLCDKSISPVRKPAGAKPEPGRRIAEKPYPPKDHIYDQYQVRRWMTEHDRSLDDIFQFFELTGGTNGANAYKLISNYR